MITMLHSTAVFRNFSSKLRVAGRELAAGLVAAALTVAVVPANAQAPATPKTPAKAAAPATKAAPAKAAVHESHADAHASADAIPAQLAVLKLTPEQQAKIIDILHKFNGSISVVSKQFADSYMKTIETEAVMLAAVEDNLTDAQREQVRAERSKSAHQEKAEASHDEKAAGNAEAEIAAAGITLTEQQQEASEEIHHNYRKQMRALHRNIHHLHHRLLSLESDKLAQIEKVLTKEQLTQLRATRHHPAQGHGHDHAHGDHDHSHDQKAAVGSESTKAK